VAVPAVETGTLNRSAAILMRAGFASRLAAIKAVHNTEGDFHSANELKAWLNSERVEQLSAAGNWPSTETAEMWSTFRASYTLPADQTWKKTEATVDTAWQQNPRKGSPVHLLDDPNGGNTLVLSPDLELIGTLRRKLDGQRRGLTLAIVGSANQVEVTYLGPDKLFAA
jgi:hypothetical protein